MHANSMISGSPMAGDVDGDGELEIVFGTASGHVHVLRAATGKAAPGFPFRTHGRCGPAVGRLSQLGTNMTHPTVRAVPGFPFRMQCRCSEAVGQPSTAEKPP